MFIWMELITMKLFWLICISNIGERWEHFEMSTQGWLSFQQNRPSHFGGERKHQILVSEHLNYRILPHTGQEYIPALFSGAGNPYYMQLLLRQGNPNLPLEKQNPFCHGLKLKYNSHPMIRGSYIWKKHKRSKLVRGHMSLEADFSVPVLSWMSNYVELHKSLC